MKFRHQLWFILKQKLKSIIIIIYQDKLLMSSKTFNFVLLNQNQMIVYFKNYQDTFLKLKAKS
jgi:hypothetical protein